MPELPEVEVVTRALQKALIGRKVRDIAFFRSDLREPMPMELIEDILCGRVIDDVQRRSKYIILSTKRGQVFLHLGMTGRILRREEGAAPQKHTHVAMKIVDRAGVYFLDFEDPRRFGRMDANPASEDLEDHRFFRKLGPEPLERSAEQLAKHLFTASRSKSQAIKNYIMDNHVMVGVGNIYANESLFEARIHPLRAAKNLSSAEFLALSRRIQAILRLAIRKGGTTFSDFRHTDGSSGGYAFALKVYDREGEACRDCGQVIASARTGGRSSFFCTNCQN